MLDRHETTSSPVTKVGAVILHVNRGKVQFLLNQPRPKPETPDDMPRLGFVRGTRMYRGAGSSVWLDADHDGHTLPPAGVEFQPLLTTLAREMEEEASLSPAILAQATITDLGVHRFASSSKTPYDIHWFAVFLPEDAATALPLHGHRDAVFTQWVTLAELQAMVAQGNISSGYSAIADYAIARLGLLNTNGS